MAEETTVAARDTAGGRLRSNIWLQAGAVTLVALALRLIYLLQIKPWPFFFHPVLDARSQYQWAVTMTQTPLWTGTDAGLAKAPLYSYFLAWSIWLFGDGNGALLSAHALQLVLGALTCGLTYLIARKAFGETAGLIAGLLAAVFAPQIFNEGELLDTSLATFLSAAFLLALLDTLDRPTVGRWLGTGLVLGLLGITRPNLLVLAPLALILLLAWLRKDREGEEVRAMAFAFLGGLALIILPITLRNAYLTHEFIPIATNGGINFYTGNNPTADGCSPIPAGVAWERSWYEWKHLGWLTAKQQDKFYQSRAMEFWRKQPGRALALLVKKAYLYWNGYDVPNNVSFYWGREHASLLRALPLGFGVVGVLGLLGMVRGARRNRDARVLALAIAAVMLSIVIVFVAGRYRVVMLPALFAFAGFAVVEIARAVKQRDQRALLWSAVGLVAFGLLVNSDLYGVRRAHGANRDYFYLGQCYDLQGDRPQARNAFLKATQAAPGDADAWAFLGFQEMNSGQAKAAAEHLRKALDAAPDYSRAAGWLAEMSLNQNWPLSDARQRLERALSLQGDNIEGRVALIRVNLRQDDARSAGRNLEQLADSFSRYNPNAAQYGQIRGLVAAVVAEAQNKGLSIPEKLQGGDQPPAVGMNPGE